MKLPLQIRNRFFILLTLILLLAAGSGLYIFTPRPVLLDHTPFSTAYYDRNGTLLRLTLATDDKYRLLTPLTDFSPDLITATLTQEDRHFYRHPGVNPFSILRASFETYILRSRPIGGSTITMQVVRMRDNLDTRGIPGKFRQMVRALQLERHYSKEEILEAYLNLAPYGGNIHGAGTAALIYFRQPAKNLALPQSLGLAVIPQNPVRRFPLNTDGTVWAAARQRLFEQLPKSYAVYAEKIRLPLTVLGRDDLPFRAPHFLTGIDPQKNGTVNTTLDLGQQNILQQTIAAWLEQHRGMGLDNAAVMLLHAPTMEVRALIGSGDFFDIPTDGQVDGTAALRSPGSTLKPFVYALALEQGLIHPETLLSDDPAYFAEYRPGNFDDRFIGAIPAHEALSLSRNVPAIALAARLQNPDLYDFLQNAGATLPKNKSFYGLSMVVGGVETDMRTLVRLYAMLANGGMLQDLKFTTAQNTAPSRPLLSPEAALLTLTMLERPDPDTPPFTAGDTLPVYWKTGTSSGFRDAWTIGVFGPYVLAVWTGHFDGRPSPALVGVEAAAPLFFTLANAIRRQAPLQDMVHPAMEQLNLSLIALDGTKEGWFIPGKSPFTIPVRALQKPDILTPRPGITYVSNPRSREPLRIPLEAKSTADQRPIYWFADNQLIGVANDNAPLFWSPTPGNYIIRTVDSQGRSASNAIRVVAE
ncbi:MAG: penicillin-binding protein 1C [Micavibrio sp.]